MELPGFDELSLPDLPLFSTLSTPEFEFEHTAEWTYEENKQFEDALAEFDPTSPFFFENVASKVPWKSIGQIKKHYEALVEDIEMIESGLVPVPDYREAAEEPQGGDQMEIKNEKGSSSRAKMPNGNHSRRRGLPWTEEEHKLFLMGLNKFGKGDWRSISRHYVVTKNPTQVASHAQKFFRRQNSSTPRDRRRPSIHDIQSVNSTSLSLPQRHRVPPNPGHPVPISQPFNQLTHMNNPSSTNGELSGGLFPPGSSTFPIVNSMVTNQPSGEDHPSFRLPFFLGNQPWG